MSEDSKIPSDSLMGRMSLPSENASAPESNPLSDTEAQMRRALGLFGNATRIRSDDDRGESAGRGGDRFGHGGHPQAHQGLHRRRFVQDGEVPVTVVRRDAGADGVTIPQSSRLQRTEAALAAETANREKAERALADAQNQIRDLRTKIGHAELARAEAVEIARREREAAASLVGTNASSEDELQELRDQIEDADQARRAAQAALSEERTARKAAERSLRDAIERADRAEAALRLLEQERAAAPPAPAPVVPPTRAAAPVIPAAPPATPARRGRPPGSKSVAKPAVLPEQEPEPVKWWLLPAPKTKAAARARGR